MLRYKESPKWKLVVVGWTSNAEKWGTCHEESYLVNNYTNKTINERLHKSWTLIIYFNMKDDKGDHDWGDG